MAAPTMFQQADSPTLKRAFPTFLPSYPCKKLERPADHCRNTSPQSSQAVRSRSNTSTRCSSQTPPDVWRPSMVQTTSRSFKPMPSFGSVFGGEVHQGHTVVNGGIVGRPASSGNTNTSAPFSSFHMHHDSRDSNSTTSSDNSPTTTISTMDSSSVTDPSPGPSPESPLAKTAAPSSFVADFRSRREAASGDSSPNAFFELQRPTTPAKKARNIKSLGINTASSLSNLRAHTPAPIVVAPPKERNSSAPPSPLFIKPPTPPKRRPSNLSLTISTPGSTDNKPVRLIIPSTPSLNRPALRHFQSSPSLPLCSPSAMPVGGMQLPTLRPIVTNPSGLSEVPFEMEEEEDQEPNFDIPQSREEKPAAYPNGPICIYEAGVYLYFEPTAEQAATFDVIVNVASEVKNPFSSSISESQKDIDARRVDGPPAENVDFASLSQRPDATSFSSQDASPTTPKATPTMSMIPPRDVVLEGKSYRTPLYIHMPWEHNTDIVSDLHKLVKIMDENVQQGKRVLVHCQCGVSRSASLIVAYGLYKDPQMSVQDAYDKAKKRSKWIGPNMNLIMQLQEFRNGLLRQNESRSFHNQPFGRRSAGLPTARSTGTSRPSPFDRDISVGPRTPQTAPLPPDVDVNMQRASTGNMMAISPGPLSAPTGAFSPGFRRSWDASQTHFELSSQPAPYVDTKGHILPIVSITDNDLTPAQSPSSTPSKTIYLGDPVSSSPPVPNFSRQLPLRSIGVPTEQTTAPKELTLGLPKSFTMDALRSPAVASFNIPSFGPKDTSLDTDVMSPVKTSFDANAWPQGYDLDSAPVSPVTSKQNIPPSLAFSSYEANSFNDSPELMSPRTGSFNISQAPQIAEPSEITSPVKTSFPSDIFGSRDSAPSEELKSPRATEFHMTPLKPREEDSDPYGLTSPKNSDFPSKIFGNVGPPTQKIEEDRRPSFQAILPPSHQTFNGFASLDGAAQIESIPSTVFTLGDKNEPDGQLRIDSLSPSPEALVPNTELPPAEAVAATPVPQVPETPKNENSSFLSTPVKGIRTRFSSPNLREQRKLHKLQTQIKSKLPKPAVPQHAADDIDALMSPRAEEFTRNPFHFDIRAAADDSSPASSNETIKDGRNGHDWSEPLPRQWTPEKATVDPRSPVQTGSSPIVRNIWDVL